MIDIINIDYPQESMPGERFDVTLWVENTSGGPLEISIKTEWWEGPNHTFHKVNNISTTLGVQVWHTTRSIVMPSEGNLDINWTTSYFDGSSWIVDDSASAIIVPILVEPELEPSNNKGLMVALAAVVVVGAIAIAAKGGKK